VVLVVGSRTIWTEHCEEEKSMKLSPWFVGALAVLAASTPLLLYGQVYAPNTEFHDPAQRLFVVEAARVLAWRENHKELRIHRVTYQTSIGEDRKTNWQVDWLDDHGKTIHHFEVNYPESLLTSGPGFYREVFSQLCGKDLSPTGALTEQELLTHFWEAAESAGLSRAEGLRAALKLVSTKPSLADTELAPRLAGVLSHTTLPSLSGAVSMDVALLARAAAWLCLAESMTKDRGAASDTLWVPILFLAGRENAATGLWKSSNAAPGGHLPSGNAPAAWDFFLRRPKAHEVFAFAARPQNRQFAMPMMVYYASLLEIGHPLAEVVPQIFGKNEQELGPLHDFSAFMSCGTGVGGGRILEGRWPVLARQAWIELLDDFQPAAPDYTNHVAMLTQTKLELKDALANPHVDREMDASLVGFKATVPLLEQGFHAGVGPLVPVATVTTRDLLNFGWEMAGLQMGERHRFVGYYWGITDRARPIIETVLHEVSGLNPFFVDKAVHDLPEKMVKKLQGKFSRLQFVQPYSPSNLRIWQFSLWDKTSRAANARLYVRRCWLGADHPLYQLLALSRESVWADIGSVMRRYRAEGGPRTDYRMLCFFGHWLKAEEDDKIDGYNPLRQELGQSLPDVSSLSFFSLLPLREAMPPIERAQQMERAFWLRPETALYEFVFSEYIIAHAYPSARRFYDQAEPVITDRVSFSNTLGPKRYMLALLENDEPAMQAVLKACKTYSSRHLDLLMLDCFRQEDWKGLTRWIAYAEERYELTKKPGSSLQNLKEFVPLIPAFKDPQHPDHTKALDHFAQFADWWPLQWLLITMYKPNTEDAVRFFGGLGASRERLLIVYYLLNDKSAFEKTYSDLRKSHYRWSVMGSVAIPYLRNQLLETPVPPQEPDLKPVKVPAIAQAVAEELALATTTTGDLSVFTSADALWTRVEQLKRSIQPASSERPARQTVYASQLKAMLNATEEFLQRYPADPRRWDAKLLQLHAYAAVDAAQNSPMPPADFETALKEIASAPDVSKTAKADADYMLVLLHARSVRTPIMSQALEALDAEILAFEKNHPNDKRSGLLRVYRFKLDVKQDPAKTDALLGELAKSRYPEVAQAAQRLLDLRSMLKKPLDWKFTAADGATVNLASLRGKVVLLDFWASWRVSCIIEAPQMVELYKKLHEKGLEIIGVSLDHDLERMLAATKASGMAWPQFFDRKGRENELAVKCDVQQIPTKWLLDKKGMVRSTNAREGLQQEVEKLLAE
jgi:thiol-disulfide isomerase/thioredoxin